MKKFLPYILIIIVIGIFTPIETTDANTISNWIGGKLLDVFPTPMDLVNGTTSIILRGILVALSWILWLSGQLLNFVLQYTIVDMSTNLSTLTGINIAWKVIRDLMNIAFIFMLIYEGIMLIIGQGSTQQIKKFIIGIVLASILINFSLFFTKVMIDASNTITIGFYNSILGPQAATAGYGLSNPIVTSLGISSLYDNTDPGAFSAGKEFGPLLIMGIGSGAVILVSTFIFFAVAIMFIVRYVTLIILLMLSPIAYMGMALPFMSTYSKQWWSAFKSQLLFAPIYMILTWVTLILMSSSNFVTQQDFASLFNTATRPSFGSIQLIMNFAIIIGLLIASLIIAKSTSTQGSKHIGQAIGKLSAFAGGAVLGTGARLSKNTIGRAGNAVSNSAYLKDKEVSGGFVSRNLARYSRSTGTKAATSSFDVRNTSSFGAISDATGVKMGKGFDAKKFNFQKGLEDRAKKEADYAKSLKPTDLEKDRIKERTGHSALEENEKRIKGNIENTTKVANELLANQQKMEQDLVIAKEAEVNASNETEREEANRKIKNLQDQIALTKTRHEEQKNRRSALDVELKSATEKIKESQKELDKIYMERVEGYANMFENESRIVRYTKNAFKIPLSLVTGVTPTTRNDNLEIARKIRSANKEKSKKEKLADLAKEVSKEDDEESGSAQAANNPAQEPTPTPTTPPADNPTT